MHIHGSVQIHRAQTIHGPHRAAAPEQGPQFQVTGADEIDFTEQMECIQRVRDLPDIRHDKVARIKAAIQAGVYETDEKIELALERLLDEIG